MPREVPSSAEEGTSGSFCSPRLLQIVRPGQVVRISGTAPRYWPLLQVSDALVHVGIDGVVRLGEVAGVEHRLAHVFGVVATDGIGEDWQQIVNSHLGWFHQLWIV